MTKKKKEREHTNKFSPFKGKLIIEYEKNVYPLTTPNNPESNNSKKEEKIRNKKKNKSDTYRNNSMCISPLGLEFLSFLSLPPKDKKKPVNKQKIASVQQ